jgi:lysozyme
MQGIDVSHYQGPIDWQQVANHGIQWAATKATQGTSYVDPTLSDNAYGMAGQESIKYRLYYHFLTPADPIAQAHWFISHIAPLPLAGLMADVEGQPVDDDAVATFCDEVERLTGRPMAIYVGVFYNGGTIWKSTKVWKQGQSPNSPSLYD